MTRRRPTCLLLLVASCATAESSPSAHNVTTAVASSSATPPSTPVIRYDDLGLMVTVRPGYRVIGDAELARRIGAHEYTDTHLRAELLERLHAGKTVPLLALAKESDGRDVVAFTIFALVEHDADTPLAIAVHEQKVMAEEFVDLVVTGAPTALVTDGVDGAEWSSSYILDRRKPRVGSHMRVYRRGEITFIVGAVGPDDNGDFSDEATRVLDAVHFAPNR